MSVRFGIQAHGQETGRNWAQKKGARIARPRKAKARPVLARERSLDQFPLTEKGFGSKSTANLAGRG
ncbi:MAG: hypothetical protein E6833_08590, partial [Bradyrhizobium sp.]|nr:hypothetical protein [Bradyrhizobium sp.]